MTRRLLVSMLVLGGLSLNLLGCVNVCCPKRHYEESRCHQVAVEPQPLKRGEVRYFEFPPDGFWHTSPVLVMAGDHYTIEAQGWASGLEKGAAQYRVGVCSMCEDPQLPLFLAGEQPVTFEHMGPLQFMANSRKADCVPGMLTVKITKNDGPKAY